MSGPTGHATLSPSAASRWLACPASIRLSKKVPHTSSVYADEGTAAHAIAELTARYVIFGEYDDAGYDAAVTAVAEAYGLTDDQVTDMRHHGADYAALLASRLTEHPHSRLLLEQRMETGVPRCWGTGDAVIVSPRHVEVVDYKYGAGVRVDAAANPQLMLYAVAALDMYADVLGAAQVVSWTIFQPRIGDDGHVSTDRCTPDELRAWRRDVVIPVAREALGPDAAFGPSPEACRWCPARGDCRARMEASTREDFTADTDLLTDGEVAELLPRLAGIKSWCDDVQAAALRRAYAEGHDLPGHKVVLSSSRRTIRDDAAAVQVMIDAGLSAGQVSTVKAKGVGELDKVLRRLWPDPKERPTLDDILGDLLERAPGKPVVVAADDPREPVTPEARAVADFG